MCTLSHSSHNERVALGVGVIRQYADRVRAAVFQNRDVVVDSIRIRIRDAARALHLERADVRAVTATCIREAGQVARTSQSSLIRRRATAVALIDRDAGAAERSRRNRTAVVL